MRLPLIIALHTAFTLAACKDGAPPPDNRGPAVAHGDAAAEAAVASTPPETAPADVSDGTDGGGGIIDCESCVAARCAAEGPGCGSLPGAKRALCEQLLACIHASNCAAASHTVCWCGSNAPSTCVSTPAAANGPCRAEEVAAAESNDGMVIASRYTDGAYASGAAHNRAACERELCPSFCTAGSTGSRDASAEAPVGATDAAEPEVRPTVVPVESGPCGECLAANCPEEAVGCSAFTGGKRLLCDNLLACVRRTQCAKTSSVTCWCGTAPASVCSSTSGAANGPCRDEEVAAAESSETSVIAARFTNPTFASGAVHNRVGCERDYCATVCPR